MIWLLVLLSALFLVGCTSRAEYVPILINNGGSSSDNCSCTIDRETMYSYLTDYNTTVELQEIFYPLSNPYNYINSTTFSNITISNCTYYNNTGVKICYQPTINQTTTIPTITPLEDLSGNGYNLTNNGAVYNTTGQWYNFDSEGDYLGNISIGNRSNLSVFAWIYQIQSSNSMGIFSSTGSFGANRFSFMADYKNSSHAKLLLIYRNISSVSQTLSSDNTIYTLNNWHLVGFTLNSTVWSFYVDGNFVYNISAITGTYFDVLTYDIGKDNWNTGNQTFNGSIDNIIIFNTSLNSSQITQLYSNISPLLVAPESVVAWYPFTNQTGNITGIYVPESLNITGNTFMTNNLTANKISVGDGNNLYPLEVNSNVSGVSIWSAGNVSATGYITRTSVFDASKSAFDYIKDSSAYVDAKGEILHSAFYGYTTYNQTLVDMSYVQDKVVEVVKCGNETFPLIDTIKTQEVEAKSLDSVSEPVYLRDSKGNVLTETRVVCGTTYRVEKTYPKSVTLKVEGVELGMEIDVLRQGLYELNERVKLLENDNLELKINRTIVR